MLHFAQHDKCGVIPSAFFCHSERSFLSFRARARNPVRCGCFASLTLNAPFSMTSVVSFQVLFFVIPSESEESIVWMLHFAYAPFSMTSAVSFRTLFFVIPSALFCHSERSFLSFRAHARNPVWMLHCACAPFSMTSAVSSQVLFFVIPSALFCHSERERGIQCDVDASLRLRSTLRSA